MHATISGLCRWSFVAILVCAAGVGEAVGQEAREGDVQTRPVLSVALAASSTGKDFRRVVYAPPPGWYIRSHQVVCTSKTGLSSYTVNTVPAHWDWSSEATAADLSKGRADAGVSGHGLQAQVQFAGYHDGSAAERQSQKANHHALVVEAVAQGPGLFRGGASLELTVVAEMVYVGRDRQ